MNTGEKVLKQLFNGLMESYHKFTLYCYARNALNKRTYAYLTFISLTDLSGEG